MEKRIYDTLQIRQIEQKAFASGIASEALMERAGSAVLTQLRQDYPDVPAVGRRLRAWQQRR
jgi:NAD(P)H-hydrate repair Nnr-like enzyme with NAD(P)H-hydrate epimerase domain